MFDFTDEAGAHVETLKLLGEYSIKCAYISFVEREGRRKKMRKNLNWISSIILLILSLLGGLAVNTIKVSSVEPPAIYIVPAETWNTSLTPGMNYQISIRTNYTGDDIYSYQFELEYNPNVLHGGINNTDTWIEPINMTATQQMFETTNNSIFEDSEKVYVNGTLKTRDVDYLISYTPGLIFFMVAPGADAEVRATYLHDGVVNGDLITTEVNATAQFDAGVFDNTLGKLWQTSAYFYYPPYPPDTASGPGILANVTFHVVGYGVSDITLSSIGTAKTKMRRYNATADEFEDIDTILQHGFFSNLPPRHDVAVTSLVVPATAAIEQPVPISVTVSNEGTYDESVTLTVKNDSAVIDTTVFTLEKGLNTTESFSWDTSGLSPGSYTINATATIASDDEPGDNSDTQSVTLSMVHDVAVTSLVVPTLGTVEHPVPINVTVSNEGSYAEDVTLTVYNETTVIDTVLFSLAKGPTSNTSSFSWNTSGIAPATYTINATATIASDDDLSDNNKTKLITLQKIHNVRVVSITAWPRDDANHNVNITVTVENTGSYTETFNLTAYYMHAGMNDTAAVLLSGNNYTTVTLSIAESKTIIMTWNTTGVVHGFYDIKANATIVTGETNTNDNELDDGEVLVAIPGDIDGDGDVDPFDFSAFRVAYGSLGPPQKYPADPNWNALADLDCDGDIDPFDFSTFRVNYGKVDP
jgi:hypothetical protein